MLPSHRSRPSRDAGWQDMTMSPPDGVRRRLFSPYFRSRTTRFVVLCGVAFALVWWVLFSGPDLHPPLRPPPPHPITSEDDSFPTMASPDSVEDIPEDIPVIADIWAERAEKVREAFLHAYNGYERFASPHDELLPMSNGSIDNFNGWGVTMVDSLDTMFIMGLQDEFQKGLTLVDNITFIAPNNYTRVPFFETTIRYLGGLLSAYALSKEPILLQRADELGAALLPVFNTTSGLPQFSVNTRSGYTGHSFGVGFQTGWLAEIASCQMEYKYLAHVTGKRAYYDVAHGINMHLYNANATRLRGLLPTQWNLTDGKPLDTHVSIGAMADSGYEYLLKQYLLTDKIESEMLELYLRTSSAILDNLVYLSPKRNLLYATDVHFSFPPENTHGAPIVEAPSMYPSRKFEHLSCFLPGLYALGAQYLPDHPVPSPPWNISHAAHPDETPTFWMNKMLSLSPQERERHKWAAEGIAYSCWMMYADQPSGLGPEEVTFVSAWELEHDRLVDEAITAAKAAAIDDNADRALDATLTPTPTTTATNTFDRPAPDPLNDFAGTRMKARAGGIADSKPQKKPGAKAKEGSTNGGRIRVKVDNAKVNQTAVDERLLWANALAEWRASQGEVGDATERVLPPGLKQVEPVPAISREMDYHIYRSEYLLRPETLESIFLMWRTTGDIQWRERGWAIFEAIEKEARTANGYATVRNVNTKTPYTQNSMPSFFLAETLKYLYLMFVETDVIPLDKWVLNTEAHPLPVFRWTEWQMRHFEIATRL